MIKLPANISIAGDSHLTQLLRQFLDHLDRNEEICYCYDEITVMRPWHKGAMEFFLEQGILRQTEPSALVWLWECEEPDWVEPIWLPDARHGGRVMGFYDCRFEWCGIHTVEQERTWQWAPSLEGIVATLGTIWDFEPVVVVPKRVVLVGTLDQDGNYCELFLVRGATWKDAAEVIGQAERLKSSPSAAILSLNGLPSRRIWSDRRPPVISLAETMTVQDMKVRLNLQPLLAQMCTSGTVAGSSWLTVTEASELLMRDFPGLELEAARARVSLAAGRGAFATNNQARRQRRIDAISFSAWRLQQRDKDLDAEDEE